MTHRGQSKPEIETAALIEAAQARAVVGGIVVSLLANSFIALTTAVVLWLDEPGAHVLWWIAALLSVNILRLALVIRIRGNQDAVRAPGRTLALLSAGAFAGGLAWAFAPFIGGINADGANAYVVFIIGGICAGALMQSTAYSRTALLFATPPLAASIASLMLAATPVTIVIAADVLLLSIMMFRASRLSEDGFIRAEQARLKAVSLASSLATANAEIRQSYGDLETLANSDPLTGLGNRALFNDRLSTVLAEPARPDSLALLVVDLDRFKAINDTMGHGAGDIVLKAIAGRLAGLVGPFDTVARLGGDEFAVIVAGSDADARARVIGREIVRLAGEPIDIDGRPVVIGASAGLALYPEHGETAETLFASADIALYAAKEGGRRRLGTFNPVLKARIERQRRIEATLSDALDRGEVDVHVQPQVALASGRVVGFEALLRWTDPVLGPVSPPDIVQAAHALHIPHRLTAHVTARAAAFLKTLPALGLPDATVAINVSPRDFSGDALSALLIGIARDHGIDPARMEIEITEEATLDTAAAGEELARLEAAGFSLAVDDFGMGHSSLAYLVSLHVDRLKVDRSFVTGLASSRENQALISALIGIGRALSIDIVVEGVETAEQEEVLRMLGCRFAQGYRFARPMPVDAVAPWLAAEPHRIGRVA